MMMTTTTTTTIIQCRPQFAYIVVRTLVNTLYSPTTFSKLWHVTNLPNNTCCE